MTPKRDRRTLEGLKNRTPLDKNLTYGIDIMKAELYVVGMAMARIKPKPTWRNHQVLY
jgi:hypothetical protein